MKNGFIKTAAVTVDMKPANVSYNTDRIIEAMQEASDKGAAIIVFPELAITGATCGDLYNTPALLKGAFDALEKIAEATLNLNALVFVGLPVMSGGKVRNAAAAINKGEVLGFNYKTNPSDPGEKRFFGFADSLFGMTGETTIKWHGQDIPSGNRIIYRCNFLNDLTVACEIGSDMRAAVSPGTLAAMSGAGIIVNTGGEKELPGSSADRTKMISVISEKNVCGYVYAGSGLGESTGDQVYSGHSLIAECGRILCESRAYSNEIIYNDIDVEYISYMRGKSQAFESLNNDEYWDVGFDLDVRETELTREYPLNPFVPENPAEVPPYLQEVLDIQSRALAERLSRINCKHPVVGISGGLDSTLALIVSAGAMDLLGLPRTNIEAVTMPCFGTTQRTKSNADLMIEAMGASYRVVNISDSVRSHFRDIGHDEKIMNAAYENAQARERTQVLMDIANDIGGIVVGTGDLSEFALGWATYNGDHMSMYGVNASIPKTLVRLLVAYYADNCGNDELKKTLYDVIDTPVSPELIPGKEGQIQQKTEDLVGPYEIHDFIIYYTLACGFTPDKVYRIAVKAMKAIYDPETILHWMNNFYRRFFSQQFKRSCSPEGPQAGPVSLSPRGGLVMPSDAAAQVWLDMLKNL